MERHFGCPSNEIMRVYTNIVTVTLDRVLVSHSVGCWCHTRSSVGVTLGRMYSKMSVHREIYCCFVSLLPFNGASGHYREDAYCLIVISKATF
jgi:hypothetical protein